MRAEREEIAFDSCGSNCVAWLYRPPGEGPHPCVVLAHGFAGTREARLWAYAERFREAGLAALVFDYRHFGGSGGAPRQLLSVRRQHEDWRAAIACARRQQGIDPSRIALWGTSFSGGHVVVAAAADERIAAVVAQTPFADGLAVLRALGARQAARLALAGLEDVARAVRGRPPRTIPAVGLPGELAAMSQPGSLEGYRALFADNPDAEFHNEVAARVALRVGAYRPVRSARRLRAPLLVVVAGEDEVTPPRPALRMAELAPRGQSVLHEGAGHFDIYIGELFERTVAEQAHFLVAALAPLAAPPG